MNCMNNGASRSWFCFLSIALIVVAAGVALPLAAHGGSFIDKNTFCYVNVSYFRGGFLSDSKLIVKINNHKVNFFGDEYSKIMRYGGTDSAIVNDLLTKGKNTITVEIERVSGAGASDKEPCEFGLVLELKKKGEMVDTGKSVSPIFRVDKKLEQHNFKHPVIAQGEFVI
jgi:hypothetical protein